MQAMINQDKKLCSYCKSMKVIAYECKGCQKGNYCSDRCKTFHSGTHQLDCKSQVLAVPQPNDKTQSKKKNGLVGLTNLGNTCYLNSCLQCLSHTEPITQYFLIQGHKKELNQKNPDKSSVKLVEAYGNSIKNLWQGDKEVYNPIQLKSAIGKINPTFAKYSQEDSNQFFNTLIDTINEELNRVKVKPTGSPPNIYGKSAEDAARIIWLHYYSRNQSIITDTMTGLFKSKLKCLDCTRESLAFQTFTEVNLQIPNDYDQKELTFYVLYHNFRKPVRKESIQYKLVDLKMITQEAKKKIGEEKGDFHLYFLSSNKQIKDCSKIQEQDFEIQMEEQKAFLIQLGPDDQPIQKFALTCFFSQKQLNDFKPLWVKRPFFINLKGETGGSFTIRILKYLYRTVYNFPQRKTVFGVEGKSYSSYESEMLKNKPFKFVLLKSIRREGNRVCYDLKKYEQVLQMQLISDAITNLLQINEEDINEETQQKIELALQIEKHAESLFNFERLNDGIIKVASKLAFKEKQNPEMKETSLYKCLDAFCADEMLYGDNLWFCPWCQQNVKAKKNIILFRTPDILVFVINRFKLGTLKREKNLKPVSFPFELDLEKYADSPVPISSYIQLAKKKCIYETPSYSVKSNLDPIQKFELYAFIHHSGELNHGHYTAFIENNKKWYHFDDKKVSQVEIGKIDWKNAYILFYKRKKVQRSH